MTTVSEGFISMYFLIEPFSSILTSEFTGSFDCIVAVFIKLAFILLLSTLRVTFPSCPGGMS
jgi:hypothetical protein